MSARILIVDDNPLNVKLLAAKLAHDYYVVTTATNGFEAVEKVKSEKPDIVLLDVMMPEMDGFEACKLIKADATTAHIPVIMVTALSDVADRVRGLEAGADDFLTKPINDIALMARVRSLLRLKMVMDEWRLREATFNQFSADAPGENAKLSAVAGGEVLLLEDNPSDQKFIMQTLAGLSVRVTFAGTVSEASTMAHTGQYDLIFASLDLKNEDGLTICPQIRTHEISRQIPILLLGNETDIGRIAKGLDLGANDYLMRPIDANELMARTRIQLRQRRHYQRLRSNYEQNMTLALVDPLTGAFNRRYLEAHMPRLLSRAAGNDKPLSIFMIDIDHFKKVNDTHGHAAGDAVLKAMVSRTMQGLRPTDLVVRMGGEEFAVIMPETNVSTAQVIAERLRERIQTSSVTLVGKKETLNITISIGIASTEFDKDNQTADIFERADAALMKAKETGRNRIVSEEGNGHA